MMKAKVFIYVHPFEGMPTEENFRLIEEHLPPLKDGGKSLFILFVAVK